MFDKQRYLRLQLLAMGMSNRSTNCLLRAKYVRLEEINAASDDDLLANRQLGERSLREIRSLLSKWEAPTVPTILCPACNHRLVLALPPD